MTKKVLTRKVMKKTKGGGGIGTTAGRRVFCEYVGTEGEDVIGVSVEGGNAVAASARRRVGP